MKLLGLSLLFVTLVHAMPEPKVKSYVRVTKSEPITLAHIVDWDNDSSSAKTRLSKVVLGDGPKLGEQRVFTSGAVAKLVRQNLPELNGVKIPNRITVENRGYELTKEEVKTKLARRWERLCKECRFVFRSVSLPILPSAALGKRWRLEDQGRLPRGSFSRRLEVFQDHGAPVVYWISGRVEIHKKVPVSKKAIEIGHRFRAEDIAEKMRDVTFATDGLPTAKEIEGQQAKRAMRANEVIWASFIQREKALTRGDLVKVVTGSENWELSLRAIAEQDGYIGDYVKVRNIKSRQLMNGRVTAKGEVEIQ